MSFGPQYPQQVTQPVSSPKSNSLPAGEHRRALGGIMLALWLGVAVNAITAACSMIQQVRAHKAQQELDDAKSRLQDAFKALPLSPRKS